MSLAAPTAAAASLPEVDARETEMALTEAEVTTKRQETPGHAGWPRVATPGAPNKYFIVSTDCHIMEPPDLYAKRVDAKYRDRLPRVEVDREGRKWSVQEGFSKQLIRDVPLTGSEKERAEAGHMDPLKRLADHDRDGIDAEIGFPGRGGLLMFSSQDAAFVMAQCRVWNDWAWETFAAHNDRLSPVAQIGTQDVELAVAEVERVADLGFRTLSFPTKPIHGPGQPREINYNDPSYDRLWAAVQDTGLPMVFHIATGRDPRTAKGNGGSIINYAVHAQAPAGETVANLCCSGVFERFPRLRFATVESGIGWVAWMLQVMDESFYKQQFLMRPRLQEPPSVYYRRHGLATFQEDPPGLALARDFDLMDNIMWANDYPHHEGTWPHSAAAIERTMSHLTDAERAKVLGLNAAKFFGFDVRAAPTSTRPS
jgi:predicted TIM-barrel fold metal-dependent hydrolase